MPTGACVIPIGILHRLGLGTRRTTAVLMAVLLLVLARVSLILVAAARTAEASGALVLNGDDTAVVSGLPANGRRGR